MSVYWDYSGLHGEDTWTQHFRTGLRQSPINILTRESVRNYDYPKSPLNFNATQTNFSLVNKGYNVSFKPIYKANGSESWISGGPLTGSYCFEECHFHWGRGDNKGCEHEVDGKRFDAELHLVHRYKECTFPDAINRANGLCVLGIFIEADDPATSPPFLSHLIGSTKQVRYKGDHLHESGQRVEPYKMLEGISQEEYFTYEGSLTTPPLSECVRWIVFKSPIKISRTDYELLQNIIAVEDKSQTKTYHDPFARRDDYTVSVMPKIGDNYRRCCRSDGRKIESSF